jgi:hypothetical protein
MNRSFNHWFLARFALRIQRATYGCSRLSRKQSEKIQPREVLFSRKTREAARRYPDSAMLRPDVAENGLCQPDLPEAAPDPSHRPKDAVDTGPQTRDRKQIPSDRRSSGGTPHSMADAYTVLSAG